jgi:hypothetical protein
MIGGFDDRPVTGNVCHRRERIHLLRTGDAGNAVHSKDRSFAGRKSVEKLAILCRAR